MPISYNTDLFSVPSQNRQKEMKKEKSVQIARPTRKPSTESEVDPLLAKIQEKSAKVRYPKSDFEDFDWCDFSLNFAY